MIETELTIMSEQGLHARTADSFVRLTNRYLSDIRIRNLTKISNFVNAKSILKILTLGIYYGHRIQITAEGQDEAAAIKEIAALITSNFLN